MKKHLANIFLLALFYGCVKDKPIEQVKSTILFNSSNKIFTINEGNFQSNNSSVSLYDESSNTVAEDIYKQQNNLTLGDICQSITNYNNRYYIVVNNSSKIEVTSAADFKRVATISSLTSPRYLLPITHQKAYVSDLYANAISIVDLNSNSKIGAIPCSGWTEQMALIYNKVFVTNLKSHYVYVINSITDQLIDSVYVGLNASSLVVDKYAKLWVLSQGDVSNSTPGLLTRINPITYQIEQTISFNTADVPTHLTSNNTHDNLYFLNNGVWCMPITQSTLPITPLIPQGNKLFYGLGINPINSNIYVSDAIDYVQKSKVYVYSPTGNLITSFNTGVNTSDFFFD